MCCTLAAHHVLCMAHGIWCSLHRDGVDRWSAFCHTYLLTCTSTLTEWLQHRNCELGNNTRNSTIKEVGCSGSMSSPLANHFWINTWHKNTHNKSASKLWHDVRYVQTDRQTFLPAPPLGGIHSGSLQLCCDNIVHPDHHRYCMH